MSNRPASPATFQSNETHVSHRGFRVPDPFAPRQRPGATFVNAVLATAFFRCWHILVLFGAWSTLITVLNHQGHKLNFQPTLLTLVGTVLGFVISYRTTSSFERYNEGRKLWSQVIFASRTLARTIWFHVIDKPLTESESPDNVLSRSMIEKKSAINLLEAFAVSIKHYLRGEDGIYYQDLYYLVKFLPAYALPAGRPSMISLTYREEEEPAESPSPRDERGFSIPDLLPPPVTAPRKYPKKKTTYPESDPSSYTRTQRQHVLREKEQVILSPEDEKFLFPGYMPPKYHLFDLFPFSLLVGILTAQGKDVKGKKAAKIRAKMRNNAISHNLPHEISLYLSSYIATLQRRGQVDVPTSNLLLASLGQLVDSLTGFERILTTPIPFSYSIHLWVVTVFFCFALPFQIWATLRWVTIPSTVILCFFFFGFLVAGEEIQDPFGYDNNDLNLDHFTNNIIRSELRAITSTPPPDLHRWAFAPENDLLFANRVDGERISPSEWMERGHVRMQMMLSMV